MSGTKGDAIVTPGTKLGKTRDFASGPGSYVRGDFIYASLLGKKELVPAPAEGGKATIQVVSRAGNAAGTATAPTIGSVATVKITKINQKFATASIICVGDVPLKEPFAGIIRYQDVRPTEIDTVEISKCFRPGDVVRAEVISLGDAKSYYLSTAKNEYGVIYAKSVAGVAMTPVSWNQMVCPKTHNTEFRKVAKIE